MAPPRRRKKKARAAGGAAAGSDPPAAVHSAVAGGETKQHRFHRAVMAKVREVEPGMVTTYGAIAKALGLDNYSRHVGFALAGCDGSDVPWWRVINSSGKVSWRPKDRVGEGTKSNPFTSKQRVLLEKEGHWFSDTGTLTGWTRKLHEF